MLGRVPDGGGASVDYLRGAPGLGRSAVAGAGARWCSIWPPAEVQIACDAATDGGARAANRYGGSVKPHASASAWLIVTSSATKLRPLDVESGRAKLSGPPLTGFDGVLVVHAPRRHQVTALLSRRAFDVRLRNAGPDGHPGHAVARTIDKGLRHQSAEQ